MVLVVWHQMVQALLENGESNISSFKNFVGYTWISITNFLNYYNKMKQIFFLFTFLNFSFLFSQNIEIKGIVTSINTPISDVLIEIKQENKSYKSISNEIGNFKLVGTFESSKFIFISAYKEGFLRIKDSLIDFTKEINLSLKEIKPTQIEEIIITANNNIIEKSYKTIFKVNSKDFLKNSKADVALKTIPNVSITNQGITIDNRKKAMLFIDGIESSIEDLNRLDIKEINKIEVMSNPSASYGEELTGGVINIIRKEPKENFYKGEIEAYRGIRLNSFGIIPSISYKNKTFTFKTFYSYGINNQSNNSVLNRINNSKIYNQISDRDVKGWQDYLSSRLKVIITQKSNIVISGNSFRYSFNGSSFGEIKENNITTNYESIDKEKLSKVTLNSVYNYRVNNENSVFLKFKYFNYSNTNSSTYLSNFINIFSNIDERTIELNYEKSDIKLFTFPVEISIGYKNTFRKFDFNTSNFNISQNINSLYLNSDLILNDKFSFFTSLLFDNTSSKNSNIKSNYNNLLPSLSILYKINTNNNLRFDYTRKITRPSANYLNPNPIFINPINTLQGNPYLQPQIKNTFELTLSKKMNNNNPINLKIFNEIFKNLITETFSQNNGAIINTFNNIGTANITGVNLSFTRKLFKKVDININNGVNYNYYNSNSTQSIIQENKGYSFNSSINVYATIKDRVSLNLNSNFNSHNYDLIQTTIFKPLLNFDAETAMFKDKLNIRLSYFDMFSLYSKTKNKISYLNFEQNITNINKMTNLTLTLIYSFGKSFNDRFSNPIIENIDIKTK